MYYWITAVNDRGRTYLVGYKQTEGEAQSYIEENLRDKAAEVHPLTSPSRQEAARSIKHEMIRTKGFESATRNFRHKAEVE